MVFSIFTELGNHHHNLICNVFTAPKRTLVGYIFFKYIFLHNHVCFLQSTDLICKYLFINVIAQLVSVSYIRA